MIDDATLEVAVRAVQRAASVVIDAARDVHRLPAHMDVADLVAEADGAAQDAIIATLRAAFPTHSILGDESGRIPGARDGPGFKWLIDALEGKANFAHGYPHYAVTIAHAQGLRVTHALILDPVRNELFTAVAGKGAELNGVPIHISACPSLDRALVATDRPRDEGASQAMHTAIGGRLGSRGVEMRQSGVCSLDLAAVAAGRMDGFWSVGIPGWELAAGALLVAEAGGRAGDFGGTGSFLRGREMVAAAPVIHAELRDVIAGAVVRFRTGGFGAR